MFISISERNENMHKNGWIIYNDSLPGNKFIDFAEWIQSAAEQKGSKATIFSNRDVLAYIAKNNSQILVDHLQMLPDYVVFTDKDIYLAKQLELLGIPVFNQSEAIRISDDKIATYQKLAAVNLPIPRTIIYPKTFFATEVKKTIIQSAVEAFGFPMIVKEAFGSFGEQVYLVHTDQELSTKIETLGTNPFMLQEFITSSYGVDLRLHVVGDQVVAAMKRQSANDFRANVTAGGTMEAYQPNDIEQELAIKATKAIGADFAGVDLLLGPDQNPIVCEVNSNAHIHNLYDCTGINVADFMIDYILHTISGSD
jgi:RimK family alpha-L-glutamate ligase